MTVCTLKKQYSWRRLGWLEFTGCQLCKYCGEKMQVNKLTGNPVIRLVCHAFGRPFYTDANHICKRIHEE